jgi:hypothetical protein
MGVLDGEFLAPVCQAAGKASKTPSRRGSAHSSSRDSRRSRARSFGRARVPCWAEYKRKTIETETTDIDRNAADVLKLDVFVSISTDRIVHDLRDPQRHTQGIRLERGLIKRAPVCPEKSARLTMSEFVRTTAPE